MKCRVCGLETPRLQDRDPRPGHLDVSLEFGPNVFTGRRSCNDTPSSVILAVQLKNHRKENI
eukprot:15291940-Alexandrium_andersonii.AAC.1